MNRSINWLDQATRSIYSRHKEAAGCADYIAQRLSGLVLQRLPSDVADDLVALLPETTRELLDTLQSSAHSASETSIGYHEFVDRTAFALGCSGCISTPSDSEGFEPELQALAKGVTDTYLWAFAHELPPELKARMVDSLPTELRARMNLYQDVADGARVA